MSSVECLRAFVTERLTAAEDIFRVVGKTIVEYEEEIARQRRLLDIHWLHFSDLEAPSVIFCSLWSQEKENKCSGLFSSNSSILFLLLSVPPELPQQHVCKEEEVLSDQELNTPVITSVVSEANGDHQLLSHNSPEAESQDQKGGKHGDSGSTRNAEPERKKRRRKSRSHSNNVDNTNILEIHRNTQTGKKSSICDTCGKDLKYKSALQRHLRVHTGEKPYSCKTCGKDFQKNSELLVHVRRAHTGEKPYVCKTCRKRFCDASDLLKHVRTHTGEKPYVCKTCRKRFCVASDLLKHMRTHTGEKPYVCKTCGKEFGQNNNLSVHIRRAHTGEKPYVCKTYRKGFCDGSDLLRHMRIHRG
ncbi:zinc finger protein 436-like [Sander lucioperca]|uniref:zinc finger protein 436-like n=1 Tax=Sander lucioperca TaxID=283035 RepID=UPI0016537BE6|nr:zinc finger protein 436-like [Sander lucioperca]